MTDDGNRSRREGFREGVRQGLGILSAFKDAIEDTIGEARDRGDLSPDRAREIIRTTVDRAQAAADEARERFDFVSRSDLEELQERVDELAARVTRLESGRESGASDDPATSTGRKPGSSATEAKEGNVGGGGPTSA